MYECRKCKSSDLYLEQKNTNIGLYCNQCGSWQKWISKKEVDMFKFKPKNKKRNDKKQLEKDIDSLFKETAPFECLNESVIEVKSTEITSDNIETQTNKIRAQENLDEIITIKLPLRLVKELINCIEVID